MTKRKFVLDENILILAEKGTNERGEEDTSSGRLIEQIAENCHAIALDSTLYRKYTQRGRHIPRIISLLGVMLRNAEKMVFLEHVPAIEKEPHIPEDDVPLVRLAISAAAILATTDDRLRIRLNELQITETYNLTVVRPEVAIAFTELAKQS